MGQLLNAAALCAVIGPLSALAADQPRTGVPVAAGAQVIMAAATVKSIDAAARNVVLLGADGREHTVQAGPQVANFAQLRVGDRVNVEYVAAVALELRKGGSGIVSRAERGSAARAKPGEKPALGAAREVAVTASVLAIDAVSGVVTLKGPKQTVQVFVRDAQALKRLQVGDQVEATYTEAVAISVAAGN